MICSRGFRVKWGTVAPLLGYPTGSSISSFSWAGLFRSTLSRGPQLSGVVVTVTSPAFYNGRGKRYISVCRQSASIFTLVTSACSVISLRLDSKHATSFGSGCAGSCLYSQTFLALHLEASGRRHECYFSMLLKK